MSIDCAPQPCSFSVQSGLLQGIDGVPYQPLKNLDPLIPFRYCRVGTAPLADDRP